MIGPAVDAYHRERLAQGAAPASLEGFDAEAELETALAADRTYVWSTILALTLAWVSNAAFRWPVSGLAALLEVAAFAGLAAQQIDARGGTRRALGVYVAWAALACAGATRLPADAVWLAAAPVGVALLLAARNPTILLLLLPVVLPWVHSRGLPWGACLAQSLLLALAAVIVTAGWRRSAGTHLKRFWDRVAVAAWIVLVLPSTAEADAVSAVAAGAVGLAAAWTLRHRFRNRRSFLPVVLIWVALHLLGLRTDSGSPLLRLGLILPGFLLLVAAGWRFAAARPRSLAPCRIVPSPLCAVPDLERSRDYPLQIYVR